LASASLVLEVPAARCALARCCAAQDQRLPRTVRQLIIRAYPFCQPSQAHPHAFKPRRLLSLQAHQSFAHGTARTILPPQRFSSPPWCAPCRRNTFPCPGGGRKRGMAFLPGCRQPPPGRGQLPADRAALQPPQERAHGSLRAAESPERLHAPMGEGGGVCALQGCKPSGAPIFLAVWRLHGRRGTGSVGYVVTVGDQQSLPAECQRSNFAIHFLRKRILQWPGE
jgi:hypothetical protein